MSLILAVLCIMYFWATPTMPLETKYLVASIIIHYPEQLHRLTLESGVVPSKVVSWVYNSNTAKQHRDIGFYNVIPNFKNVLQPYKNPNDKRVKELVKNGKLGGRLYDWWNVNQVKNVSKAKTKHPCQMPLDIMKNIIGILPQDVTIIDPFMGSGTTAEACIDLGVDFVGVEIDVEYFEISRERISRRGDECEQIEIIAV